MFGSITSGGALADDGDVNDWASSRLGAALEDDDDLNDWAITFGGLRLMMMM